MLETNKKNLGFIAIKYCAALKTINSFIKKNKFYSEILIIYFITAKLI